MSEIGIGSWAASKCVIAEFFKMYLQKMIDDKKLDSREAAMSHAKAVLDLAVNNGDVSAAEVEGIIGFIGSSLRFFPSGVYRIQKMNKFICKVQDIIAESFVQNDGVVVPDTMTDNKGVFEEYTKAKAAFEVAKTNLSAILREAIVKRLKEFVMKYQAMLDKDFVSTISTLQ